MVINVFCCGPVCFYHACCGDYPVYIDSQSVCVNCNDVGGYNVGHGLYNSHDVACSDDDRLLRDYGNQNMLMDSSCCMQTDTQVRKPRYEHHSHRHTHLLILN